MRTGTQDACSECALWVQGGEVGFLSAVDVEDGLVGEVAGQMPHCQGAQVVVMNQASSCTQANRLWHTFVCTCMVDRVLPVGCSSLASLATPSS